MGSILVGASESTIPECTNQDGWKRVICYPYQANGWTFILGFERGDYELGRVSSALTPVVNHGHRVYGIFPVLKHCHSGSSYYISSYRHRNSVCVFRIQNKCVIQAVAGHRQSTCSGGSGPRTSNWTTVVETSHVWEHSTHYILLDRENSKVCLSYRFPSCNSLMLRKYRSTVASISMLTAHQISVTVWLFYGHVALGFPLPYSIQTTDTRVNHLF